MRRFFQYAFVLCMAETLIVTVALLVYGGGLAGFGELRVYLVFLGIATLTRVLINIPLAALCIKGITGHRVEASRLAIAGVNFAVYASLVAPMVLLSRVGTDLPLIYSLYGVACLISPLIPWIKAPSGVANDRPAL